MSLRGRLMVALLVVVLGGLLAADLATYQALRAFLVQRVDTQVDSFHQPIEDAIYRRGPGASHEYALIPGAGTMYAEIRQSGVSSVLTVERGSFGHAATSTPAMPASLPTPPACSDPTCDASTSLDVPSKEAGGPTYRVHVWALPGTAAVLAVALPLSDVSATLSGLVQIEGIVTGLVLALAFLLGLYLVRVGLRPLTAIETTAGAIAGGDLSRRVDRAETRTEVGRLGVALNAMLGQIEAAFAEKDASEQRLRQFLADASHELRTPLTSIRGYAELFRHGASERPDDLAKVMRRIEEEGSRMGVLVDDLLLLARLDQGRPLERDRVDLGTVAADAVEAARVVEPTRDIGLSVNRPVEVDGDPTRLRQVVDNLLANVRTHTPAGSPATVRVAVDGSRAVLEVSDSGPGLPADGRERIFTRFFRADPSRSRDRGGAGLGLAIVDAIVRAHGGTVSAGDAEPGGARFRVELPLRTPGPG